jgi:CHASE2 domain-containing sensor protein
MLVVPIIIFIAAMVLVVTGWSRGRRRFVTVGLALLATSLVVAGVVLALSYGTSVTVTRATTHLN